MINVINVMFCKKAKKSEPELNNDSIRQSVDNFKQALDKFELEVAGAGADVKQLFERYDHIRACKQPYLDAKAQLRRNGMDVRDNPHVLRFKKLNERLNLYERQLLMFGVNVKTRELTTNSALLTEAERIGKDSTSKLRDALTTIHNTIEVATGINNTLAGDREKIEHVSREINAIDGELDVVNRRVTNFMKRLSTDKVFIAMTGLTLTTAAAATGLSLHMI